MSYFSIQSFGHEELGGGGLAFGSGLWRPEGQGRVSLRLERFSPAHFRSVSARKATNDEVALLWLKVLDSVFRKIFSGPFQVSFREAGKPPMTKSHCLASKPNLEMSICSVWIGGDHWLSGYSRRLPTKWTAGPGSINVRNDQFSPLSITFIIFCESHFGGGYGWGAGWW